jgi:hypothetical protein
MVDTKVAWKPLEDLGHDAAQRVTSVRRLKDRERRGRPALSVREQSPHGSDRQMQTRTGPRDGHADHVIAKLLPHLDGIPMVGRIALLGGEADRIRQVSSEREMDDVDPRGLRPFRRAAGGHASDRDDIDDSGRRRERCEESPDVPPPSAGARGRTLPPSRSAAGHTHRSYPGPDTASSSGPCQES